jgi:hypothetical protein
MHTKMDGIFDKKSA